MAELADAAGGAAALVLGGVILILLASEINTMHPLDLHFWGIAYILVGILAAGAIAYAAIQALIGT